MGKNKADRSNIEQLNRGLGQLQLNVDEKATKLALDQAITFSQRLATDYAELNRRLKEVQGNWETVIEDARQSKEDHTTLKKQVDELETDFLASGGGGTGGGHGREAPRGGGRRGGNGGSSGDYGSGGGNGGYFDPDTVTKAYLDTEMRRLQDSLYKLKEVRGGTHLVLFTCVVFLCFDSGYWRVLCVCDVM
jgi:hypothetical protein